METDSEEKVEGDDVDEDIDVDEVEEEEEEAEEPTKCDIINCSNELDIHWIQCEESNKCDMWYDGWLIGDECDWNDGNGCIGIGISWILNTIIA